MRSRQHQFGRDEYVVAQDQIVDTLAENRDGGISASFVAQDRGRARLDFRGMATRCPETQEATAMTDEQQFH